MFPPGPGCQVDWEEREMVGEAGKHWEWDTAENARTKERMKKMKDHMK